jgi:solute carrier family 50 protein (sugar transporter)
VQLRVLYVLAGEAVFMVIVVLSVLLAAHTHERRSMIVGILCIIFGTAMYASPLTVMVSIPTYINFGSIHFAYALFP